KSPKSRGFPCSTFEHGRDARVTLKGRQHTLDLLPHVRAEGGEGFSHRITTDTPQGQRRFEAFDPGGGARLHSIDTPEFDHLLLEACCCCLIAMRRRLIQVYKQP